MANLQGFDANQVEPVSNFEPPAGRQIFGCHHRLGDEADQGGHRKFFCS